MIEKFINDTDINIHISAMTEVEELFRGCGPLPPVCVRAFDTVPPSASAGFSDGSAGVSCTADKAQYAAKKAVFMLLSERTSASPAWGSLTGVKPLKLLVQLREKGLADSECREYFSRNFLISKEKMDLLLSCLGPHMEKLYPEGDDFSLYVHIPLCLSKCTYCSFPSAVTPMGSPLCEEYLEALEKEITAVTQFFRGRRADSCYIGGGTPSILSSRQAARLLGQINELCPDLEELTFEAGRADTLDEEKLRTLRSLGVTRISLNPQTSCERTLSAINRRATFSDFLSMFGAARDAGFGNINCDIIFGLGDETREECFRSLSDIIATGCENITLHTLCKKRTSELDRDEMEKKDLPVASWMDDASEVLKEAGYVPYYLYRQKSALDNAENTGYCRPGYANIYNIRMMGERQTILSAGAGSTTKVYFPQEDRFENIYNIKNIRLYIDTIDQVIDRKLSRLEKVLSGGR